MVQNLHFLFPALASLFNSEYLFTSYRSICEQGLCQLWMGIGFAIVSRTESFWSFVPIDYRFQRLVRSREVIETVSTLNWMFILMRPWFFVSFPPYRLNSAVLGAALKQLRLPNPKTPFCLNFLPNFQRITGVAHYPISIRNGSDPRTR